MITEALLNIVFGLIGLLLKVFSLIPIPDMPASIVQIGDKIVRFLEQGASIALFFFDRPIVLVALSITLVAHNADHAYSLLRFILSKLGMNFD